MGQRNKLASQRAALLCVLLTLQRAEMQVCSIRGLGTSLQVFFKGLAHLLHYRLCPSAAGPKDSEIQNSSAKDSRMRQMFLTAKF